MSNKAVNIAVLGAPFVGKTSLLKCMLNSTFHSRGYLATKLEFYEASTALSGGSNEIVDFVFMDTPGRNPSTSSYVLWADALLLVYSITDTASFNFVQKIITSLPELTAKARIPVVILGTKADLDGSLKRTVLAQNGIRLAKAIGATFFETSAKTSQNVASCFARVLAAAVEWRRLVDFNVQRLAPHISFFNERFHEDLAVSGRRLLRLADVVKVSRRTATKRADRHLVLFNDSLLYTLPRANGIYHAKGLLPLKTALALEGHRDSEHSLQIVQLDSRQVTEFIFSTVTERDEFLDQLALAIHEFAADRRGYLEVAAQFLATNYGTMLSTKRIFGIPLKMLLKRQANHHPQLLVPIAVKRLLDCISRLHIQEPGLFRLPGSPARLEQMRGILNGGNDIDLTGFDALSVSSLLLSFLKLLPTPLIPSELNSAVQAAIRPYPHSFALWRSPLVLSNIILTALHGIELENRRDQVERLREIVVSLPIFHFHLLSELCRFLKGVFANQEHNKCSPIPTAKIFATCMFSNGNTAVSSEAILLITEHTDLMFQDPAVIRAKKMAPAPEFLVNSNTERLNSRLSLCKQQILTVLDLLKSIRRVEFNEFEGSLQNVIITLNDLANYELTFVKEVLDTTYVDTFYMLLTEMEKALKGQSKRNTSKLSLLPLFNAPQKGATSVQRILSNASVELDAFFAYLDESCRWTSEERAAYFKVKKESARTLQVKQAVGLTENDSVSDTMKSLQTIFADPDARIFWDKKFGLDKFRVDANSFIMELALLSNIELTHGEHQVVSHILDYGRTGFVHIQKFAQFLSGFGPIKVCLGNLIKMLQQPWFHAFVTPTEANRLLESEPPGTFMVRFSSTTAGNFAIDYVLENETGTEVRHIRIANTSAGFLLADEGVNMAYPSIEAVIDKLNSILLVPFRTDLLQQRCFHGDLSGAETEDLMRSQPEGSFLIRFSSQIRCLTVSWISVGGILEHFRLERVPGTTSIVQGTKTYASLSDCVQANSRWLRTGLPRVLKADDPAQTTAQPPPSAGVIGKIVAKLYDGNDVSATAPFLLTYRAFATPSLVLDSLRERFQFYRTNDSKQIRLRICNFVKIWITEYWWDLEGEDEMMFDMFRSFFSNDIMSDSQTLATQLITLLQKQRLGRSMTEFPRSGDSPRQSDHLSEGLSSNATSPAPLLSMSGSFGSMSGSGVLAGASSPATALEKRRSNKASFSTLRRALLEDTVPVIGAVKKSLVEFDPLEVAQQMTLMENELFQGIQTWEFLNQGWLKADKEERSPNLLKMIRFSNTISSWISTEILQEENIRKRVNVIDSVIAIAQAVRKLNNYNGLMEILAGLSNSGVGRLKKTWEMFNQLKKRRLVELDELRALISTDGNFKLYRESFSKSIPPKIQYLGGVLTDMVFVEDGNPTRLENGDINWTKCERVFEVLQPIKLAQQEKYAFPVNAALIDYILDSNKYTDSESYKRSLFLEPREATASRANLTMDSSFKSPPGN